MTTPWTEIAQLLAQTIQQPHWAVTKPTTNNQTNLRIFHETTTITAQIIFQNTQITIHLYTQNKTTTTTLDLNHPNSIPQLLKILALHHIHFNLPPYDLPNPTLP